MKHSVLIIDDEVDLLESLKYCLLNKYNVKTAESGDEGLRILAEDGSIDCILLDVLMPGRNGIETLKFIRYAYPDIPVLVFTGCGDTEVLNLAKKYCATGYLEKPLPRDVLCNKIDQAIEAPNRKTLVVFSKEILLVDDNIELLKSLANNLNKLPYTIHTASSGKEALNIMIKQRIDILITDIRMPEINGIKLIEEGKKVQKDLQPIVITGGTRDDYAMALEAMKKGAISFLHKPIILEDLMVAIEQGLEKIRLIHELNIKNSELLSKKELLEKAKAELEIKVEERTFVLKEEIRERKMLGKVIEEKEKLLRTITSAINDAIIMVDNCGKVSYWNSAAENIFGYSSEMVLGKNLVPLIIPEKYRESHQKAFAQFGKKGPGNLIGKTVELTGLKKNGKTFPIELSLSCIKTDGNWHAIGVVRDITDRHKIQKELETHRQQLIQSDKMASIGTMAAGIAHEINNSLTITMGDIHLFKRDINSLLDFINRFSGNSFPPEISKDIERLKKEMDLPYIIESVANKLTRCSMALDKIKDIVRSLRDFSHIDTGEITPVDINKSIENVLTLVPKKYKLDVEIKREFALLPKLSCKGGLINQVFINIIINALQAMDGRGVLKIETMSDEMYISIKFCDSGPGIPEEKIKQVFDPFYTTKPVGKGTGLGLSISYSIIKGHGGKITVVNNIEKGVTFSVELHRFSFQNAGNKVDGHSSPLIPTGRDINPAFTIQNTDNLKSSC